MLITVNESLFFISGLSIFTLLHEECLSEVPLFPLPNLSYGAVAVNLCLPLSLTCPSLNSSEALAHTERSINNPRDEESKRSKASSLRR